MNAEATVRRGNLPRLDIRRAAVMAGVDSQCTHCAAYRANGGEEILGRRCPHFEPDAREFPLEVLLDPPAKCGPLERKLTSLALYYGRIRANVDPDDVIQDVWLMVLKGARSKGAGYARAAGMLELLVRRAVHSRTECGLCIGSQRLTEEEDAPRFCAEAEKLGCDLVWGGLRPDPDLVKWCHRKDGVVRPYRAKDDSKKRCHSCDDAKSVGKLGRESPLLKNHPLWLHEIDAQVELCASPLPEAAFRGKVVWANLTGHSVHCRSFKARLQKDGGAPPLPGDGGAPPLAGDAAGPVFVVRKDVQMDLWRLFRLVDERLWTSFQTYHVKPLDEARARATPGKEGRLNKVRKHFRPEVARLYWRYLFIHLLNPESGPLDELFRRSQLAIGQLCGQVPEATLCDLLGRVLGRTVEPSLFEPFLPPEQNPVPESPEDLLARVDDVPAWRHVVHEFDVGGALSHFDATVALWAAAGEPRANLDRWSRLAQRETLTLAEHLELPERRRPEEWPPCSDTLAWPLFRAQFERHWHTRKELEKIWNTIWRVLGGGRERGGGASVGGAPRGGVGAALARTGEVLAALLFGAEVQFEEHFALPVMLDAHATEPHGRSPEQEHALTHALLCPECRGRVAEQLRRPLALEAASEAPGSVDRLILQIHKVADGFRHRLYDLAGRPVLRGPLPAVPLAGPHVPPSAPIESEEMRPEVPFDREGRVLVRIPEGAAGSIVVASSRKGDRVFIEWSGLEVELGEDVPVLAREPGTIAVAAPSEDRPLELVIAVRRRG